MSGPLGVALQSAVIHHESAMQASRIFWKSIQYSLLSLQPYEKNLNNSFASLCYSDSMFIFRLLLENIHTYS